jgi:hypothetical protein
MIKRDKILHLSAGLAISFIVTISTGSTDYGNSSALIAGIGKEIYDYFHPEKHTAEGLDIAFTALGGVIGSALALII